MNPGTAPGPRIALVAGEASGDLLGAGLVHVAGRLHLELTRTHRDGEESFNAFALHASADRGIPVVASNDVRFLDANGFDAHEARVCISTGRVLDDPKRPRDYSAEQFLKSSDQMETLFADVPDAIDNALALALRCNLELSLGTYYLPAFPVPSDETLDTCSRHPSSTSAPRVDRCWWDSAAGSIRRCCCTCSRRLPASLACARSTSTTDCNPIPSCGARTARRSATNWASG